jgi:hypothetical protein
MERDKEDIPEEEDKFGELCRGRRYKRRMTRAEKGELQSELEGRVPCEIIQFVETSHIRGEEEELQSSPIIEESLIPT